MERKPTSSRQEHEQELVDHGLLHEATSPITPVKCGGRWIGLLTPRAFELLPDGTVVISIHSYELTKGVDYIDLDARGGQIAFGLPIEGDEATRLTERYGDPTDR